MHATTEIKVKVYMIKVKVYMIKVKVYMIKTTRLASPSWIAVGKKILWEAVIIASKSLEYRYQW